MNTPVNDDKQKRAGVAWALSRRMVRGQSFPFRLLVIVAAQGGANVTHARVHDFMHTLVPFLQGKNWVNSVTGFGTDLTIEDKDRFVSKDSSHAVLYVEHQAAGIPTLKKRFGEVEDYIDALATKTPDFSPRYSASVVQESLLLQDASEGGRRESIKADVMTVAIGFAILTWNLGWSAAFALPVLLITFLLFFAVSIPFEKELNFEVWEPSIFFGAGMAVSFDYSLFLLSCFRDSLCLFPAESRTQQDQLRHCMAATLVNAGHPVLLSGLVLGMCFFALTLTDFASIKSIGTGGVIIVGSALLSSLSLLPALMLCFGRFRLPLACEACSRRLSCSTRIRRLVPWQTGITKKLGLRLWRDVATMGAQCPRFVLFLFTLVFLLALPFTLQLTPGADQIMLLPETSRHAQAFQGLLASGLRGGLICPLYAVVEMMDETLDQFEGAPPPELIPKCVDNDLQFAIEARYYLKDMKNLSCGEAQSLFDICNGDFRMAVLYLCPQSCGVCDSLSMSSHSISDELGVKCEVPVVAKSSKPCQYPGIKHIPGIEDLESCRTSCCHDPACTFLEWFGNVSCRHGRAMTKQFCANSLPKDDGREAYAELLYRPNYVSPFLAPSMWNATMEIVARIRAILVNLGRPCSSCVHSITELPDGTPVQSPLEAHMLLHTDVAYAGHFRSLVGERASHRVRIELPFSPFSLEGEHFLRDARVAFPENEDIFGCRVFLFDLFENVVQASHDVVGALVPTLGGVCGAVFLLVGISFRSVVIPIRLLLTIAFTLVVVFALVVLKFQRFYGSIYWLTIICAIPILIGLTLDYDLFLLTRVAHYREQGYSTRDAVIRGCWKTGETISLAGIIMSVAFSSLLWSDMPLLRSFGTILVYGTIVDAFLVRALLVPALMLAIHSESNWWPRHMPPVSKNNGEDLGADDLQDSDNHELQELASNYVDMATDVEDN